MTINIVINLILLWGLWQILRRPNLHTSLGLPLVYLGGLELIHLPGAYAHALPWSSLSNTRFTELGFELTTAAACCFVIGVYLSRQQLAKKYRHRQLNSNLPCRRQPRFLKFCVVAGWLFTFALSPMTRLPTIGAFVTFASNLWIVGVALALPLSLQSGQIKRIFLWLGAMIIYPLVMMLFGGFLSYGAASTMACSFSAFVSAKKAKRAFITAILVSLLGVSFFVTYFNGRDAFRGVAWSGSAGLESRITAANSVTNQFVWLNPSDPEHLKALDERLNQNYFVGLSIDRLREGQVDYLGGESLWEGVLALVPRIFWQSKPVVAGSGRIVADMTGLKLSTTTSFGVGNVMEAYINFAMPGVVLGFLLFGYFLGCLDYYAAIADFQGDVKQLLACFLPAVAIIQPNGSFVEIMGGGVMSWIAAIYWYKVWQWYLGRRPKTIPSAISATTSVLLPPHNRL